MENKNNAEYSYINALKWFEQNMKGNSLDKLLSEGTVICSFVTLLRDKNQKETD